MTFITKEILNFLKQLKQNNSREWMAEHRDEYLKNEEQLKRFYAQVKTGLSEEDEIEKLKIFRIYRDVRFSKNKIPYNVHRSVSYSRQGVQRRGSYYLRIEPGGRSRVSGGFFNPEPSDLKRIRTEFQLDATDIREILTDKKFKTIYGGHFDQTSLVKTAPRGFSPEDKNIDLIRLKKFTVTKTFTDEEVIAPDFVNQVIHHFRVLKPYFEYMSDVLTTDLNGESIIN